MTYATLEKKLSGGGCVEITTSRGFKWFATKITAFREIDGELFIRSNKRLINITSARFTFWESTP